MLPKFKLAALSPVLPRTEGRKKRALSGGTRTRSQKSPFSTFSTWATLLSSSLVFVNVCPLVDSALIRHCQIGKLTGLMGIPFSDSEQVYNKKYFTIHPMTKREIRLWSSTDEANDNFSSNNRNSQNSNGNFQKQKEPSLQSSQVIPYQTISPANVLNDKLEELSSTESEVENQLEAEADSQPDDVLTYFLLQASATHSEVAAALAAVGDRGRVATKHNYWQTNLKHLIDHHGFTGSDLAQIIQTWPELLGIKYDVTAYMENSVLEFLKSKLEMRRSEIRKVVRRAPEMLIPREDGTTIADTVEALALVGLQLRHIKNVLVSHPRLAVYAPSMVFYTSAFLMSKDVRCLPEKLGSLYKRAPWLLGQSVKEMQQVARWLRQIGVQDVENVFRGNPEVLLKDLNYLDDRFSFLCEEVQLSTDEASLVIQTFPSILDISLKESREVLKYFQYIGLQNKEITKIIRAFPSLLTVQITAMEKVISFLEELGIRHPGRFVLTVPAILGYDVEAELRPKMLYLQTKMGLTIFDVIRFPAYFSYPLDGVIKPRTEFLTLCNSSIGSVGLNIALSPGDDDFAMKVAKSRPDTFQLFKRAFRRKQQLLAQQRKQKINQEDEGPETE